MDHKIIEALEKGPDFPISDKFGQRIMKKIDQRERLLIMKQLLWQTLGILILSGGVLVCLFYFMGPAFIVSFLPYAGWIPFIGAVLIAIQYLDSYFVRRKWQQLSPKH